MQEELASILKNYVGRESPLYHAERLSEYYRKCGPCSGMRHGEMLCDHGLKEPVFAVVLVSAVSAIDPSFCRQTGKLRICI